MTIVKEKNGTYTVRYKQIDINTGKEVHKGKRGFKLRRDAIEFEKSLDTSAPTLTPVVGKTFIECAHEWETYADCSALTKQKHKQAFEKRFTKLYQLPLKSFTRAMLLEWRAELAKMDCSTPTKNTTIQFVKGVFKFATDVYDYSDPSTLLKPFKKTNDEIMKKYSVWTPEQFYTFLACVDDDLYKLFFETLYWTGCRRGEIMSLHPDDLVDGSLHIHSSIRTLNEGRKPTKTKQERYVQVEHSIYERLLKLVPPVIEDEEYYLFGGLFPLAPTNIKREFDNAIKKSGVTPIRIHDLRHSHATWLINNGANIVAVSKRLGHATIDQTLKTYTHLLKDSDEKLLKMIENEVKNR